MPIASDASQILTPLMLALSLSTRPVTGCAEALLGFLNVNKLTFCVLQMGRAARRAGT